MFHPISPNAAENVTNSSLVSNDGLMVIQILITDQIDLVSKEQGKSEGFDSCERPSNLTQIEF